MDRQAWIAITLCIIGLIVWQIYIAKHTPPRPARLSPSPSATPVIAPTPNAAQPNESPAAPTPAPFQEKAVTLRNADLELRLTNRGGAISEAILPQHTAENGRPVK